MKTKLYVIIFMGIECTIVEAYSEEQAIEICCINKKYIHSVTELAKTGTPQVIY